MLTPIIKKSISLLLPLILIINLNFLVFHSVEGTDETRDDETGNSIIQSFSALVAVPPGEDFFVAFDPLSLSLSAKPDKDLPSECKQALELVPEWLKMNLTLKFQELGDDYKITYANLILNSPDPRYIDEIAFCIAHSARENLQDEFMFPGLFTHNAELIYKNDIYLDYVDVVEKDDYTTVIYTDKNFEKVEAPRDIYYWYIVHPKLSDELPTYVDPNYDFTAQPPFDRNYGTAPPAGKFWREWLFYRNDTPADYEGPDKNNPVLKDLLAEPETLWEAVSKLNNWMSNSMAFTSDQERPIQPVRIYRKHIGRCGEYQDMRNAIARAGLIPSTCTLNSAEDHVWNEFWDQRWIHWDGSIDKPNSYDNDLGGYFHKDLSSVWNTRGDSHIWSVTSKYTYISNYTATVLDSDGMPVDGALVDVVTENFYNSDLRTTTTWGTTDYTGTVKFDLGNYRNYWSSADSPSLGTSPAVGTVDVITDSQTGAEYSYTFDLPMSAPALKATEMDITVVEDENYRMELRYEVVGNILKVRNEYTSEHGDLYGPSGNIDFFITNPNNFNLYSNSRSFFAYNVDERSTSNEISFVIPTDESYYAVLSNGFSQATTKVIKVTMDIISAIKVEITSPGDGEVIGLEDVLKLSGTAWGPSGVNSVELSLDDSGDWIKASSTAGDGSEPYSTWEGELATAGIVPGEYTLRARAGYGEAYTITSVNISLKDLSAPYIIIETPTDGSVFGPDEVVTVKGDALDNTELDILELVIDSDYAGAVDLLPSMTGIKWSHELYTWALDEGTHSITVNAFDIYSNEASVNINFKIKDLVNPEVRISTPSDGAVFKPGSTVALAGTAIDNQMIVSLEMIIDDNAPFDITPTLSPEGLWSFTWDTASVASDEGMHDLEIIATDDSGNLQPAGISLILDGTAPRAEITSPDDGRVFRSDDIINLDGIAFDEWGIAQAALIFDEEDEIDITDAVRDGTWSYDFNNFLDLDSGPHELTLSVTDRAGFTTEAETVLLIDASGPAASITSAESTYYTGETIILLGNAYDDCGIQKVTLVIEEKGQVDITNLLAGDEWQYTLNTKGMVEGRYTVSITATDIVGNTETQNIKLRLIEGGDNTAGPGDDPESSPLDILNLNDNIGIFIFTFIIILVFIFLAVTYFGRDRS